MGVGRGVVGAAVSVAAVAGGVAVAPASAAAPVTVAGMDVSKWQGAVDWAAAKAKGASFAYVKATESTGYTSPAFDQQYQGARAAGLIHGAYHFATPNSSSGADQAKWFVAHGGAWTADGWTLPGTLDIENNPYGGTNRLNSCWGLTPAKTVAWIASFSAEYKSLTGRLPVIYTNAPWWAACTGNSAAFTANPLWLAKWSAEAPSALPGGWKSSTFWQNADSGPLPGDQDVFHGTYYQLQGLAARFQTGFTGFTTGPKPVRRGARVTATGTLRRVVLGHASALGSRTVQLQFSRDRRTWTAVTQATTTAKGAVTLRAVANASGYWRLSFPGDSRYRPSASARSYERLR